MAVAVLFVLGTFATSLHLVIDAHELVHHESPKPDDHDHSHHEPHPATDHELVPASPTVRPAPIVVEIVAAVLELAAADAQSWSPTVEAVANRPPSSPESPSRSPRAPPL